jgi:ribosomal protein L21E
MEVKDLAFFLVTHDFDAVPKKDHVEVRIDGTVYKLMPNGQYPGLANETIASR